MDREQLGQRLFADLRRYVRGAAPLAGEATVSA
jgi:hypothetical protein